MADVVVLGAGVAGHTAALHLRRLLPKNNTVTVVTPNSQWNWIPSNIWVGWARWASRTSSSRSRPSMPSRASPMSQAKAVGLHPAGIEGAADSRPAVEVESTAPDRQGESSTLHYDYLVNATGPQLKFGATEGLGPQHGHTVSVCTADHAVEAAARLAETIDRLRAGESQTLVIGMGHGTCTCEGAAFEYVFNVDHELRQAGSATAPGSSTSRTRPSSVTSASAA